MGVGGGGRGGVCVVVIDAVVVFTFQRVERPFE